MLVRQCLDRFWAATSYAGAKGIQFLSACRTSNNLQNISYIAAAYLGNQAAIEKREPHYFYYKADITSKFIDFTNSWKIYYILTHSLPKASSVKKIACLGYSSSSFLGAIAQLDEWNLINCGKHVEKISTVSNFALALAYCGSTGEYARQIMYDRKKRMKACFKILPSIGNAILYGLVSLTNISAFKTNQWLMFAKTTDLVASVAVQMLFNTKSREAIWA